MAQPLSLYIDGQVVATSEGAPSTAVSSGVIAVGESQATPYSTTMRGRLDEVAIYNHGLTPAQVLEHAQAATGRVNEDHTYDQADRLTDAGYAYDPLGRTTTVPARHAGGTGDLTAGYYANDLVSSLTQGGTTKTYALDVLHRTTRTSTTGQPTATVQHYAGSTAAGSEAADWIETINTTSGTTTGWNRNLTTPDGSLGGTMDSTGAVAIALTDLNGSIVASLSNEQYGYPNNYSENTEFGLPRQLANSYDAPARLGPDQYKWLGTHRRNQDSLGGLTLMGQRLYNPATGRFLQVDPVAGGSANNYDYVNQDPVNRRDLQGRCDSVEVWCVIGILTATETLPHGFIKWYSRYGARGINWAETDAGRRAMRSDGSCSGPTGDTGRSFNFRNACQTHDLGYDLLRFFRSSGSTGSTRRAVDALFLRDMQAHCYTRGFFTRGSCSRWSQAYSLAVDTNSLRQLYGVP